MALERSLIGSAGSITERSSASSARFLASVRVDAQGRVNP
jgi:hypothetical protein